MEHLALRLFGHFDLSLSGTTIHFRTSKARALLALLAIESDHPHSRKSLAGMLWSDRPTESAQNNLRVTLYELRQRLGDNSRAAPFIILSRENVQFNLQSNCTVDAMMFRGLVDECRHHTHQELDSCSECMNRLSRAMEVYRGEFLSETFADAGTLFEEWAMIQRERYHRQAVRALNHLAVWNLRMGNWERAEEQSQRHLELDALDENAYRHLMQALAASGRREAALVQYEVCRQILSNEVSLAPEEATTNLYLKILEQGTARTPSNKLRGLRAFDEADAPWFFGRDQVVEQLIGRLSTITNANTGTPRFVALVGPRAIGKSSIIRAGLIPALRRGGLSGSARWHILDMVPGIAPLREMEARLRGVPVIYSSDLGARLAAGKQGLHLMVNEVLSSFASGFEERLFIIIDQLEELLTLQADEGERRLFLENLAYAASVPAGRCTVLVSLDVRQYAFFANHPTFGPLLSAHTFGVPHLAESDLRAILKNLAHAAGLALVPDLGECIIADIKDQPRMLALLQASLIELQKVSSGGEATLANYYKIGRAKGALRKYADQIADDLSTLTQIVTRQMSSLRATLEETEIPYSVGWLQKLKPLHEHFWSESR